MEKEIDSKKKTEFKKEIIMRVILQFFGYLTLFLTIAFGIWYFYYDSYLKWQPYFNFRDHILPPMVLVLPIFFGLDSLLRRIKFSREKYLNNIFFGRLILSISIALGLTIFTIYLSIK